MSYANLSAPASEPSKLPIPRLHKQRSEPPRKPPAARQNRVSRACLSCRSRKIKCNGEQPRCTNCSENAMPCVYASSRKDRLKTATTQNKDMIAMLRDLRQHISTERAARIDNLLASVAEDVADAAATVQDPTYKYRGPTYDERGTDVSAEVGRFGGPNSLYEDALQDEDIRNSAFPGSTAEVQWLRGLWGASASSPPEGGPWEHPGDDDGVASDRHERDDGQRTPPSMAAGKASFYLNNEIFEADMTVDPFEMPPFETAERLLQSYMESAHNSFPILAKKTFVKRFYLYYATVRQGTPYNVSQKWQATLNLVFAIGAVYNHLSSANWCVDDRGHLLYHSRAWALSLRDPWWFSQPDLPHVQITGLLSFYYLCIGHLDRSWVLIGSAIRSGIALGMHLHNGGGNTGAVADELNSRIWWAHYNLERLISTLIGRPSLDIGYLCSVPLPLPLSSDEIDEKVIQSRFGDRDKRSLIPQRPHGGSQALSFRLREHRIYDTKGSGIANSGSYLRSIVHLSDITQAALALYATKTAKDSWESVQESIVRENDTLDVWATDLPEGLSFFHTSNVIDQGYRRERNILNILYHSTKILFMRPCLCRLDRRILHQAPHSQSFSQWAALLCVESAESIANLLPDAVEVNLVLLYQAGPWWQMVHVIMQALVVLLLEVVLESKYIPDDRQNLVPSMGKLLRWLRIMRVNNEMAVRAYSLTSGLLKNIASRIKFDITDILSEDVAMKSPTEPKLAPSLPTFTHTPYPDVLNPIEGPQAARPSPAALINTQHLQRQQGKQKDSYESPSNVHSLVTPPDHKDPQHNQNRKAVYHSPSFVEYDVDSNFRAATHPFISSSGFEQVTFPGWFITSFDELDLFSEMNILQDDFWC